MIFNQNKKERYSIVSRLLDTRYSAKESKREISIYGYAGGRQTFVGVRVDVAHFFRPIYRCLRDKYIFS